MGLPIATGVIEGACRYLVKDRLEREKSVGFHQWRSDSELPVRSFRAARYEVSQRRDGVLSLRWRKPRSVTSGTTPTANLLNGGLDEVFTRTDAAGVRNFLTDVSGGWNRFDSNAVYVRGIGESTSTGSANTNLRQYTGRENDGTGLSFYRGRYYSPTLRRFVSEDPIRFGGGDVTFYAYVGDSPTNFRDPFGLDKDKDACKEPVTPMRSQYRRNLSPRPHRRRSRVRSLRSKNSATGWAAIHR